MVRALHNRIDTARMVGLLFDRVCADLAELIRACREQMKRDDGESRTC